MIEEHCSNNHGCVSKRVGEYNDAIGIYQQDSNITFRLIEAKSSASLADALPQLQKGATTSTMRSERLQPSSAPRSIRCRARRFRFASRNLSRYGLGGFVCRSTSCRPVEVGAAAFALDGQGAAACPNSRERMRPRGTGTGRNVRTTNRRGSAGIHPRVGLLQSHLDRLRRVGRLATTGAARRVQGQAPPDGLSQAMRSATSSRVDASRPVVDASSADDPLSQSRGSGSVASPGR